MWFYIPLWGFYALGVLLRKKSYSRPIIYISFLIISVLVGYRYEVGADWYGYVDFYDKEVSMISGSELIMYEPLYYLMNLVLSKLGVSHCVYLLLFNFLCMTCLYKAINNFGIRNILLSILMYISLYFCMLNLNIIRQGMAVCIFFLGLSYLASDKLSTKEKRKKFIICLFAAIGFHYFALVLFLLTPLLIKTYSRKMTTALLVISFVLIITGFTVRFMPSLANIQFFFALLSQKMDSYVNNESYQATVNISLGYCFSAAVVIFSRYFRKGFYEKTKSNTVLVNCVTIGLLMISILAFNSAFAERFSNSLIVANVFLIPALVDEFETKNNRFFIIAALFVYMLLYYYKLIYNPNPDPMGTKPYEFYPYVVNFNQ